MACLPSYYWNLGGNLIELGLLWMESKWGGNMGLFLLRIEHVFIMILEFTSSEDCNFKNV